MLSEEQLIRLLIANESAECPDGVTAQLINEHRALRALAVRLAGVVQDASTEKHHDLVCSHRPECWYCKEINDSLARAKELGITP